MPAAVNNALDLVNLANAPTGDAIIPGANPAKCPKERNTASY